MEMKDILKDCPERETLLYLGTLAEENGFEIYLAGGFVRDSLLGIKSKDYDIGVVGDALEFTKILEKELKVRATIFKRFGTSVISYKGNQYEFVGTRKEEYVKESRNPIVTIGTMEDDINRRDFTINSMIYKLNPNVKDRLVDLHNGQEDLKYQFIRCVGDPEVVYSDDPLRMLRAIRFSVKLNFAIEEDTYDAIKRLSSRIEIISTERIVVEFMKMLKSDYPLYAVEMLEESNLLKYILPEIRENLNESLKVLEWVSFKSKDEYLRLISLLTVIDKRKILDIYKRLKFSKEVRTRAVNVLNMLDTFLSFKKKSLEVCKELLINNEPKKIEDLIKLLKVICLLKENPLKKHLKMIHYLRDENDSGNFYKVNENLSGDFIMNKFNVETGPNVGKIKKHIIGQIISDNLGTSKEDIEKYINDNIEKIKTLTIK